MNEILNPNGIAKLMAKRIRADLGAEYEEDAQIFDAADTFPAIRQAIEELEMSIDYFRPVLSKEQIDLIY